MKLLLDTHVVLWLAAEPERTGQALAALTEPTNELFLSAASVWEIAVKVGTGRLTLPEPVEPWVRSRAAALGLSHLGLDWRDAAAVADLPPLHSDPFDRLLVAQARRQHLVLATGDKAVQQYDVDVLRVG